MCVQHECGGGGGSQCVLYIYRNEKPQQHTAKHTKTEKKGIAIQNNKKKNREKFKRIALKMLRQCMLSSQVLLCGNYNQSTVEGWLH